MRHSVFAEDRRFGSFPDGSVEHCRQSENRAADGVVEVQRSRLRTQHGLVHLRGDALTTALFVHGTGVRTSGYEETLEHLRARLHFPGLQVEGCLWGEQYGSRRAEKSIFRFVETGGGEYTEEEAREDTWRLLSADPMASLRFLALNCEPHKGGMPGTTPPGEQLEKAVDGLLAQHWEELRPKLEWAQVEQAFPEACARMKGHEAFKTLKKVANLPLDPYRDAIAQTLVALAIEIAAEKSGAMPYVEGNDRERVRIHGRSPR